MTETASTFPLSRKIALILGPVVCITLLLIFPYLHTGLKPIAQHVLAVMAWMLVWWIGEAIDLAVTALLPIVLFPLLGIMDVENTTKSYGSSVIFLFMGGFLIALALERCNLHLRIALNIVRMTGTKPNRIILGFMFATAFLSLWISNTATTVMMLPIATSVLALLDAQEGTRKGMDNFALTLLLGIAYAATIGGCGTIIGTPPNTVFASIINKMYGYEVSFGQWALFGIPFSLALLLANYFIMVHWLYPNRLGNFAQVGAVIDTKIAELGKMRYAEKLTLLIFVTTALLWIFRDLLNIYFKNNAIPIKLDDTMIAIAGGLAVFLTPLDWKKGEFLMQWEDTKKMPWGILMLFGGGLSLSSALDQSGLIQMIGNAVGQYSYLNIWVIVSILVILGVFMSEVMSNVAMVAVMTPVVAALAVGMKQNPLLFTIPVTLAASCAFMLPMGTPPNAIVFASGRIKFFQMVKVGFVLNWIGIILMIAISQTFLLWIFDIHLGEIPAWVKVK
ncbi:MAG: SLC13/DASS family transporter [Bacteroidetes bacterium]|nr:MAG: SLC13/DASS family transporter [Bacteroidota bacterium]